MIYPGKVLRRGFRVQTSYRSGNLREHNWYLTMRGTLDFQRMESGNLLISFDTEKSTLQKVDGEIKQEDEIGRGYSWVNQKDIVTFVSQIKTWADKQFTAQELAVIELARDFGIKKAKSVYPNDVKKLEGKGYIFNTEKFEL